MGFVLAASSVWHLERPANPTATVLENVGRQVRAAILGAAIRPLLRVWEPSVGQVSLPLRRQHKESSEAFGNKRSNFQSCQENSEPPMDTERWRGEKERSCLLGINSFGIWSEELILVWLPLLHSLGFLLSCARTAFKKSSTKWKIVSI